MSSLTHTEREQIAKFLGFKEGYFDSDFSIVAVQNTINIFDKFNMIHNDQSAAHPNEVLNKAKAMYTVRIVVKTLTFIDKIERIKNAEAATPHLPWDDLDAVGE